MREQQQLFVYSTATNWCIESGRGVACASSSWSLVPPCSVSGCCKQVLLSVKCSLFLCVGWSCVVYFVFAFPKFETVAIFWHLLVCVFGCFQFHWHHQQRPRALDLGETNFSDDRNMFKV